jgi:imidazole glycerol phosphate synthase subunit HisF
MDPVFYYFKCYGGLDTSAGNIAQFSVVDPNSSSAFDVTTHKYTAPTDGWYEFAGTVQTIPNILNGQGTGWTNVTRCQLRRKRGSEEIILTTLQYNRGSGNGFRTNAQLLTGDEVYIYVSEGATMAIQTYTNFTMASLQSTAPCSTFEGRKLSAPPSHYFKAFGGEDTESINGTDTVLKFSIVDPASSAAFNKTTHTYTAPESGLYNFRGVIESKLAEPKFCQLVHTHGGTIMTKQAIYLGFSGNGFDTELYMETGDSVQVVVVQSGGDSGDQRKVAIQSGYTEPFSLSQLTLRPMSTFEGCMISDVQFYFKARCLTTTTLGNVIPFSDVNSGSSSAFNAGTYSYTAPVNGIYRFASQCSTANSEGHTLTNTIRISRGGNMYNIHSARFGGVSGNIMSTHTFLKAGDSVHVFAYNEDDYGNNVGSYADFCEGPSGIVDSSMFEGRLIDEQLQIEYASQSLVTIQNALGIL